MAGVLVSEMRGRLFRERLREESHKKTRAETRVGHTQNKGHQDQTLGEQEGFPLESLERVWPCSGLDFRVLAFRTVRE